MVDLENLFLKAGLLGLPRELKLQISTSMVVAAMDFFEKKIKKFLTKKDLKKLKGLSGKEVLAFLKRKIPTIEEDFQRIMMVAQEEFLNLAKRNRHERKRGPRS